MKSKIYLQVVKAEYLDTGHEIEDLTMLAGCKILSVDDPGDEGITIEIEHGKPKIAAAKRKAVSSQK